MKRPPKLTDEKATSVNSFLEKVAVAPKNTEPGAGGRLLFALDATASRQPTWDRAAHLQTVMFEIATGLGGLKIQLAFFRGYREFKVSSWTDNCDALLRLMTSVTCLAGETQLGKVLKHARNEQKRHKIDALVFVGDSFEEDIDAVGNIAGELGLLGLPCFMFQEGSDRLTAFAFQQIADLTGGAYHSFDVSSPDILLHLLKAVAVYASGGYKALQAHASLEGGEAFLLTDQLARKRGN